MKNSKSCERYRLSDSHLSNILGIMTNAIKPDIKNIIKGNAVPKIALILSWVSEI